MQQSKQLETGAVPRLNGTQVDRPKSSGISRIALTVGLIVVALLATAIGYIWFSGGSGQASAAITAPSLELQPGDTRSIYTIEPDTSEARFIIDELLLGEPTTVIGMTNEVAGEMLIDLDNPANSVLGVIRINVRTLETDNEFRNRALRGQILQADQAEFEFAAFTPATLSGLPDNVTVGEAFTFQIIGSLNLHGINRDLTFDATVTPVTESEITGTARAAVQYRDFNISIPEAPGVAAISDEVQLEIDFSAQTMRAQN